MASDIVLRSLFSPAELDAWFDLCATAFAAKGTPRSHFEAHWRDDPFSDLAGVFVADTSSGLGAAVEHALVSSVRVFARHIHLGDRVVSMGGIGEVGTRPSHAGRGLATRLLGLALDHMAERRVDVAGLHSAHAAAFYQKLGWVSVRRFFSLTRASVWSRPQVGIDSAKIVSLSFAEELPSASHDCRLAQDSIVHLSPLYDAFCRQLCGPVARSLPYWHRWWLAQCRSERKGPTRGFALLANAPSPAGNENWQAYVLFREVLQPAQPQGDIVAPALVLDIVEFACADVSGGRPAFDTLVSRVIADALARNSSLDIEHIQVRFPLPIAGMLAAEAMVGNVEALNDCLYRAVATSHANGVVDALIAASHVEEPMRSRHVFWPMDNY